MLVIVGHEEYDVQIRCLEQRQLLEDFLPLIVELECGRHYDGANRQHVEWIPRRLGALYALGGNAICLYSDAGNAGAIRFYVREGFIPVAYHPGENGLDDKGQVYLFKELRPGQARPSTAGTAGVPHT